MELVKYKKIFGVGPKGALISVFLLGVAWLLDRRIGRPAILATPAALRCAALPFFGAGVFLHFWTMYTLRNWWQKDRLCTKGPYVFFRHPMYAAWISFVAIGVVLMSNSWIILIWALLLHPIWHRVVSEEEKMMEKVFDGAYKTYAARTGRFIPRLF